MLNSAPKEKEWISWLWVTLWSLIIFVTIPMARAIQKFVEENWGRQLFEYGVMTAAAVSLAAASLHLWRKRAAARTSYLWLLVVAAVYIWYTIQLRSNPEEAVHFIQYGVLGLLSYRALTHRTRDLTIYFSAAFIGGAIGVLDEAIQWATPQRYWGLRDIWINFFGAALMQVAIAKGLRPAIISNSFTAAGVKKMCRVLALGLLLLGLSLLNTPSRIAGYASRIPFLKFLIANESVMLEYGYLYEDAEIGRFRSRFAPNQLRETDARRGIEAAKILDAYRDDQQYFEFLKIYTPITDPFLHEARVHLFRRDRYLSKALENTRNPETYRFQVTVAHRENQIMEKYFSNTLRHSSYVLPPDQLAFLEKEQIRDYNYESAVSVDLVTSVREEQIAAGLILLLFGILAAKRFLLSGKK